MAYALVTFKDGSMAALTAAQYCALDPAIVASVKLVGC